MNILYVGYEKLSGTMYPHTKDFIEDVSEYACLDYFCFREKVFIFSNFKNMFFPLDLKLILKFLRAFIFIFVDIINLIRMLRAKKYDCIICVDILAYCITCMVNHESNNTLWIYEICFNHHTHDNFLYKIFRGMCNKFLSRNKRLIIQDNDRLNVLLKLLAIKPEALNVFFMPVSLNKVRAEVKLKSDLNRRIPILLQCGAICPERLSDVILNDYQINSNYYKLFFHGIVRIRILKQIAECKVQPLVSARLIQGSLLYQLIDFCDIGFVAYGVDDLNHYYTKNSSGQTVEFLRMGKPIIVFGNTDLKIAASKAGFGVAIREIGELNHAIKYILNNYETMSRNALNYFEKNFDQGQKIIPFIKWLENDKLV